MRHLSILISLLLLGAVLACNGDPEISAESARATIEAAVSDLNRNVAPEDTRTPTPAVRYTPSDLPTATPSPEPVAQPTAGGRDFRTLTNAAYLEQSVPQSADAIKALPWIADGIADAELETAEHLTQLAAFQPTAFWTLVAIPWLQDDVTKPEASAITSAVIISQRDEATAALLFSLAWVSDEITDTEDALVANIARISQSDPAGAAQIVAMPFLQTIEARDIAALGSLQQLAYLNPGVFRYVLEHPTLSGGITHDWATIVATMHGVSRTNPGLIDVLLDVNRVGVESRTIDLPLSGPVEMTIIRTGPGARRSMDLLETAVRNSEQFMATPMPMGHVIVLFELAVAGSSAGTNFGSSISIRPKFDVDDDSHEAQTAGHIIAHEVAHYYWNHNADWVDEGAAELIASASEYARVGRALEAINYPCGYAPNIAALEALNAQRESGAFICNYSMGERILLDLYRTLGDTDFREGFRTLYGLSAVEDDADDFPGTAVGINEVRAAFRQASGNAAVDTSVARWFDGSAPYDVSTLDTGGVDSILPDIQGRIDRAFISFTEDGQPVDQFSASDFTGPVLLHLQYSFQALTAPATVHLQIVESYQDGFTFRRRDSTINARPGFQGGTQWLQVGPALGGRWAPGWHQVQVYESGRKVAEVQYTVTP